MSPQFKIGYNCNLFFYTAGGIIGIVMSLLFKRLPPLAVALFGVFILSTVISSLSAKKKKNLNCVLYGKLQSVSYVVLDLFLSFAFDSAQVFLYAMCFGSVLIFVFIDNKIMRFQTAVSIICAFIFAFGAALYTDSAHTMQEYTFGFIVLIVTNIIATSMTSHIVYQYRKYFEQEKSLDDLVKVIEVKCDEARNATRSKSQFLAHMSHEIRTPINAIVGMNEMILRESSNPAICGYAVQVRNAADSLLSIINDILDITKIEAGRLNISSVEYKTETLITDIYNMIKFRADNNELEFNVIIDEKLPSVLVGDDIHLKQILMNLLTNAVKYTHEGSVTFEVSVANDDKIFFSVRDTGIGIREEDINHIFADFGRMDEESVRNIEGTGLGLPITVALLRMFGSELQVESIYGIGSEFSFTLRQIIVDPKPIGKIDLNKSKYNHKPHQTMLIAPEAKILVVDDNDVNRMVFVNLLKTTQVQIDEASSGAECLKLTAKKKYDIIFMDHMMPHMDGVETFEIMRSQDNNACKDTPVIVLTANAVVGAKEFYLEKGFDGFLSKPVRPDQLEKTVFAYLDSSLTQKAEKVRETSVPETDENEMPVISGIDWNYARTHFPDDETLINGIRMFMKAIKSDADELCSYYENIKEGNNIDRYRVKVHSMKSSAALVGIFHLSGMALELETAAKNNRYDIISALHNIFINRWLGFTELLAEFKASGEGKKEASEYMNEIQQIFQYIREAATELDVDTLDYMSERLDDYVFDEEKKNKIQQIKSSIFNFEVEKLRNVQY